MFKTIRVLTGVQLALHAVLVLSNGATAFTSNPGDDPLSLLLIIASGICAVVNLVGVVKFGGTWLTLRKAEKTADPVEQYKTLLAMRNGSVVYNYVWLVVTVLTQVTSILNELLAGRFSNALIQTIFLLLLLWLSQRNNKGGREATKRLLGEKSKALRDKLVEAQGNLGGAQPQGA